MLKISDTVATILSKDETATEALRLGLLNLSAFADKIHQEVEKKTQKKVKRGTIITSLARLAETVGKQPSLKPEVHIEDISVKSPLCEISYTRSPEVSEAINKLSTRISTGDFFTVTQGVDEVTIVCSEREHEKITAQIKVKPKVEYHDLVSVTVRFAEKYLEIPNTIYALVSKLVAKRINIIEIVSTHTELSFIVRTADMKLAVDALSL